MCTAELFHPRPSSPPLGAVASFFSAAALPPQAQAVLWVWQDVGHSRVCRSSAPHVLIQPGTEVCAKSHGTWHGAPAATFPLASGLRPR